MNAFWKGVSIYQDPPTPRIEFRYELDVHTQYKKCTAYVSRRMQLQLHNFLKFVIQKYDYSDENKHRIQNMSDISNITDARFTHEKDSLVLTSHGVEKLLYYNKDDTCLTAAIDTNSNHSIEFIVRTDDSITNAWVNAVHDECDKRKEDFTPDYFQEHVKDLFYAIFRKKTS